MGTSPPGGLRLAVHRHPTDPLIAVIPVPHWLTIDRHSVIEDEEGQRYTYASPEEFARLASLAPFTQYRFTPRGHEIHILPPDVKTLLLKQ